MHPLLLPWHAAADTLHERRASHDEVHTNGGGLRAWPDAAVSILPVLAVHESPLLEACPSQNLGQFCLWDSFVFANCPTENRWYIWQWYSWDGWDSVLGYGLSRFLSGMGKDDAHGKANG